MGDARAGPPILYEYVKALGCKGKSHGWLLGQGSNL